MNFYFDCGLISFTTASNQYGRERICDPICDNTTDVVVPNHVSLGNNSSKKWEKEKKKQTLNGL